MSPDPSTVEGIARVVKLEDGVAWFEPEQTTSCGHCASSGTCFGSSSSGIGSLARRIEFRRFPLDSVDGLRIGDRVVVGVAEHNLLKASATAYALPLIIAFAAAGIAQALAGEDAITLAAMVGGLFAGLLLTRQVARRLAAHGDLSPRFLRRSVDQ